MLLHLGGDVSVPLRHVLAILDTRRAKGAATRDFLRRAAAERAVTRVPEGETRSAVITADGEGTLRVYLSPISPGTLARRDPF